MRALAIGQGGTGRNIGGLERYYYNLLAALPATGLDVEGFVLGEGVPASRIASFGDEHATVLRRWSGLRAATTAAFRDADIVVSHFALNAFAVLDRVGKRPFVVHFHGPWALESAAEGAGKAGVAAKALLERVVYRRGTRFITLSNAFARILEREYGVDRNRIRVIPGGVDVSRYREVTARKDARERLAWPVDRPTIVSVRRLVRAKGIENLIDAVSLVRREIPDILAVIVGTGPLAGELKARVAAAGLIDHVRFAGYVSDEMLPFVYRSADLFVVPTLTLEGFGLVVVEALACGTPVLVTPVGGLPEVVADLDPDMVFESCKMEDIARGIADALTGRRCLPSEDACRAYATRFDWPAIAQRVSAVYREG